MPETAEKGRFFGNYFAKKRKMRAVALAFSAPLPPRGAAKEKERAHFFVLSFPFSFQHPRARRFSVFVQTIIYKYPSFRRDTSLSASGGQCRRPRSFYLRFCKQSFYFSENYLGSMVAPLR